MTAELVKSRIVVVDSMRLRRAAIVQLLQGWSDDEGVKLTPVGPSALPAEFESKPDCEMYIVSLGGASLLEGETSALVTGLADLMGDIPMVIFSDRDDPEQIVAAFRAGAAGFIPSTMDPPVALEALKFILRGGAYFPPAALLRCQVAQEEAEPLDPTPPQRPGKSPAKERAQPSNLTGRQQQVAALLRKGLPNKLIARELAMTEATVKVHVRQIMRKLGATNRTQAAICSHQASVAIQTGGSQPVPLAAASVGTATVRVVASA